MNKFAKFAGVGLIAASMALSATAALATTTPGSMMPGDAMKNSHGMTSAERDAMKAQHDKMMSDKKAEHDKMMADHKAMMDQYKACVQANQGTRQTFQGALKTDTANYSDAAKTARTTHDAAVK